MSSESTALAQVADLLRQPRSGTVLNALTFQLAWFACVLGGNQLAAIAVPIMMMLHYFAISRRWQEWRIIFLVAVCGIAMDSAWQWSGLMSFHGATVLPPAWLILLWLAFATTLDQCFRFLQQRLGIAALLGSLAGPFSYLAGIGMGAAESAYALWWVGVVLGLAWAMFFPLSLWAMARSVGDAAVAQ